jgi:hypothetical protein
MYINAVADSVMFYLQHGFYNIIFKIKHKLYIASGSAPHPTPQGKNFRCAPAADYMNQTLYKTFWAFFAIVFHK